MAPKLSNTQQPCCYHLHLDCRRVSPPRYCYCRCHHCHSGPQCRSPGGSCRSRSLSIDRESSPLTAHAFGDRRSNYNASSSCCCSRRDYERESSEAKEEPNQCDATEKIYEKNRRYSRYHESRKSPDNVQQCLCCSCTREYSGQHHGRPNEETRKPRKKSSASSKASNRRKVSSWSMSNAAYNSNKTSYPNSTTNINGNNASTTPTSSGYLMPTVGCHCSHCTKVFGSRNQGTLRKKSRSKQQQQLHQQLQLLLLQQQQFQLHQRQEMSKPESAEPSQQPVLRRSYGVIDTTVTSASRKISADSAVSTTTPESLFPDSPEANKILEISDLQPPFTGVYSSSSTVRASDSLANNNSNVTESSIVDSQKSSDFSSSSTPTNELDSEIVSPSVRNRKSGFVKHLEKLDLQDPSVVDPNSLNASTTTLTTTSPHSANPSRQRTRVSYSSSSALMSPLAANIIDQSFTSESQLDKSLTSDNMQSSEYHSADEGINSPGIEANSKNLNFAFESSDNQLLKQSITLWQRQNFGEMNEGKNEILRFQNPNMSNFEINNNECTSADALPSYDEINGTSKHDYQKETTVEKSNNEEAPALSRNYVNATRSTAAKQLINSREMSRIKRKSKSRLLTKLDGKENSVSSKKDFSALMFDFPSSQANILPLYRKTLSESNIFAKDHSNVERRKQIASKHFGGKMCQTAQPRLPDCCVISRPSGNLHKSVVKINYSEVNPFSWDLQICRNRKVYNCAM